VRYEVNIGLELAFNIFLDTTSLAVKYVENEEVRGRLGMLWNNRNILGL
jgi:hypothetical protein